MSRVYSKKECDTCHKSKGESAYRSLVKSWTKTETSPTCRMCEGGVTIEIKGPSVIEVLESEFLLGVAA